MKLTSLLPVAIAVLLSVDPTTRAFAQDPEPAPAEQVVSVFLDCSGRICDRDHLRREIAWVNWARDRNDADVHLLVTRQQTGGNGWRHTFDFIGERRFRGVDKSLSHTSNADDTDAEVRDEVTQTISLGLVQYAEATAVAPQLEILYRPASVDEPVEFEEEDPWNLWMFRVSLNGSLEGEAQQSNYSLRGSGSADRVTEEFKVNINLWGEYEHDRYETSDDTITSVSEEYSANLLSVWSLGEHWSAGSKVNANHSTYENRDLALSAGPALEYDFFPYSESTRRAVALRYSAEIVYFDYQEITVEDVMSEVLPRHTLMLLAAIQQPWGDIMGTVEAIQYLHNPKTHRINVYGRLEYRLFRGLNLNLGGEFSRIKDQFYLSATGIDDDDILLERLDRETDYSYELRAGFSFVFGSKFANIVNPRMGGGGGRWH